MSAISNGEFSDLAPQRRIIAKHIVGMTAMLVEQAAHASWHELSDTVVARRFLLEHLPGDDVAPEELSCIDALFAAVQESEHTLSAVFGQPLPR